MNSKLKKVAVILSGCGRADGSEIQEAVSILINLSKNKLQMNYYAPNKMQMHVIDHQTGKELEDENRNVLIESARITRGNVNDLSTLNALNYDAVFVPGGFGAAKNLSNFAVKGQDFTVDEQFKQKILEFHNNQKIIAACCIAPLLISKCFQGLNKNVKLTLGNQGEEWPYSGTIELAKSFGSEVVLNNVDEVTTDKVNRIVTTPAYMFGNADVYQVFDGAQKLVQAAIDLSINQ